MLPTNDIDDKVEPCSFQEIHLDIASYIADGTFKLKLGLVTRLNRCNTGFEATGQNLFVLQRYSRSSLCF